MVVLVRGLGASVLNLKVVGRQAELLVSAAGCGGWDLGIAITDDRQVQALNRRYRGIDRPTDILSFPFHDMLHAPGQLPKVLMEEEKNLGDLVVSLPYVQRWCEDNKVQLATRVPELVAHGICHLLGFDHETDEEYRIMRLKEIHILRRMKAQMRKQERQEVQ